jgi:hypothetical protein
VGSCWELDANELSAQGRLEPGQSSIRPLAIGNGAGGSVVVALNLRAEAGCLYLSWRSPIAASGEERDGTDRNGAVRDGAVRDGGKGEGGDMIEIIPIVRAPCQYGGSRPYFLCLGSGNSVASCGRRTIKLYLSGHRFLCRHCCGLVYASQSEEPWQRAFRRAHKLWQRLSIESLNIEAGTVRSSRAASGAAVSAKSKGSMTRYERLLGAALQAETQAAEAHTVQLYRIINHIRNRNLQFTL